MITLDNRIDRSPVIYGPDGSATTLSRIPLNDRVIKEEWLQELIRKSPDILPVSEIEPIFAPLISIGKEVQTNAGPIDNLFLNAQGYPTIVEAKLWSNPEARRQVVGQIIDYASELRRWSYDDLERSVKEYNSKYRGQSLGIMETLRLYAEIPETEEAAIIDTVIRNFQKSRFLLVLVGDGIREDVERMTDLLHGTPDRQFTLALVELQLYQSDVIGDGTILVVPQVVTRTKEIVRAVVRVEGEATAVHISPDLDETGKPGVTLTEDEFFQALGADQDRGVAAFARQIAEDMKKRGCIIEWGSGSLKVKLPDPSGSGTKLSLFYIETNGNTYLGYLLDQLRDLELPETIANDLVRESGRSIGKTLPEPKRGRWWATLGSLKELQSHYDTFRSVVEKTIDQIRQASEESH